ncbi:hypothetical protein QAD02_009505 [Eretmocerus hayati]|uniref:Uncharacterized protein n=1 Tax=Eretmocerus hayati TaxID=131215 RepID=A0ACC2NBV0_9HYME|nr:hypothetical protein QAD02_009505 [Eretmocerus hayati]
MSLCNTCGKGFDNCLIVNCIYCRKFFHATEKCADLTASEIKVVALKTKVSMVYKCMECKDNGPACCSETIGVIKSDLDIIKESVAKIDTLTVNLDSTRREVSELKKSIDDQIPSIQGDIVQLKNDMVAVQNQMKSDNASVSETIYHEVQERITKSKNIILFKVPEVPNILQEIQQVQEILKDTPVNTSNIQAHRIGAPAANTTRPIIVTLNSPQDAHLILKNKKRIDQRYIVALDKTKMQQAQYKQAKSELVQRMSDGEEDLMIRFVNNIPTVVKKPTNSSVQHNDMPGQFSQAKK